MGLDKQVKAFAAQHADSPLMADSGLRFRKTGNVKRRVRLLYEAAFDVALLKLLPTVGNPASRRAD